MELPNYIAKVDGISTEVNALQWWKKYQTKLPYWSAACTLVQPSSAAAERVFFFNLSIKITEQQINALEDSFELFICSTFQLDIVHYLRILGQFSRQ